MEDATKIWKECQQHVKRCWEQQDYKGLMQPHPAVWRGVKNAQETASRTMKKGKNMVESTLHQMLGSNFYGRPTHTMKIHQSQPKAKPKAKKIPEPPTPPTPPSNPRRRSKSQKSRKPSRGKRKYAK